MRLYELDDVVISGDAINRDVKFILVRVTFDRESKVILRASTAEFHNGIYMELLNNLDKEVKAGVEGGGKLHVFPDEKRIRLWGESTAFGPPDYKVAEKLLHRKYQSFSIEIG